MAQKIAVVGEHDICTSIIVAAELRFGAEKRNSARLKNQVETILAAMLVVPFDVPADLEYAHLRQLMESSGNPIGPNDFLILATALRALTLKSSRPDLISPEGVTTKPKYL